MEIVTAGIPERDGCPILTRLKAYVLDQGVASSIEHIFRNRDGVPVDLSRYLSSSVSESGSESDAVDPGGVAVLRVREWLGAGYSSDRSPAWGFDGYSTDPSGGVVRFDVSDALSGKPGIYEMSFGIRDAADKLVVVSSGIMSVERTLFGDQTRRQDGPPTLNEMRMWMMDSSKAENTLIDDVEFGDEQLMLALTAPVRQWNETPPPIHTYTTRDFPFRGAWASGTLAKLHFMAASNYRRNSLQTSGAGVQVADKAKERDYLGEAARLQAEYDGWLINKKVEMNIRLFSGFHLTTYSRISGGNGW